MSNPTAPTNTTVTVRPIYTGASGEVTARFQARPTSPDYHTPKGTSGFYLAHPLDTGNLFSLYRWDMTAESGGPGPHFHRTYAETFYVLAGVVRLYDGTRWRDASAGDLLHVPAGGIHGFTNHSGAPASMLMLLTPGVDRAAYFDELASIATSCQELSDPEWQELHVRHDNWMLPHREIS